MEKLKRTLRILALISLVFCALLCFLFSYKLWSWDFTNAWRASAWVNDTITVLFYVMIWICKFVEGTIEKTLAF